MMNGIETDDDGRRHWATFIGYSYLARHRRTGSSGDRVDHWIGKARDRSNT